MVWKVALIHLISFSIVCQRRFNVLKVTLNLGSTLNKYNFANFAVLLSKGFCKRFMDVISGEASMKIWSCYANFKSSLQIIIEHECLLFFAGSRGQVSFISAAEFHCIEKAQCHIHKLKITLVKCNPWTC